MHYMVRIMTLLGFLVLRSVESCTYITRVPTFRFIYDYIILHSTAPYITSTAPTATSTTTVHIKGKSKSMLSSSVEHISYLPILFSLSCYPSSSAYLAKARPSPSLPVKTSVKVTTPITVVVPVGGGGGVEGIDYIQHFKAYLSNILSSIQHAHEAIIVDADAISTNTTSTTTLTAATGASVVDACDTTNTTNTTSFANPTGPEIVPTTPAPIEYTVPTPPSSPQPPSAVATAVSTAPVSKATTTIPNTLTCKRHLEQYLTSLYTTLHSLYTEFTLNLPLLHLLTVPNKILAKSGQTLNKGHNSDLNSVFRAWLDELNVYMTTLTIYYTNHTNKTNTTTTDANTSNTYNSNNSIDKEEYERIYDTKHIQRCIMEVRKVIKGFRALLIDTTDTGSTAVVSNNTTSNILVSMISNKVD